MNSKNLTRRILSGALALMLVSGTAYALFPEQHLLGTVVSAAAGERISMDNICFEEKSDGTYAIYSYNLTEKTPTKIVIPDEYNGKPVTELRYNMFSDALYSGAKDKIYELSLGKNISSIEPYAFWGINIGKISVSSANPNFKVAGDLLCTKDKTVLVYCPNTKSGKLRIPDKVVRVADGAVFSDQITDFVLGLNTAELPTDAIEECKSIRSFGVASGNSTFSVRKNVLLNKEQTILYAFPKMKEGAYAVPETVKKIEAHAFSGAEKLTKIYLKNTEDIGDYAFSGCTGLKSITIPEYVKKIGTGAFSGCENIGFAVLPDHLSTLPMSVFEGCTSLKRFNVPETLISVGYRAFEGTKWYQQQKDGFVYIGSRILYGYKPKGGIASPENKEVLSIKEGTVSVSPSALTNAYVTELTIPASLQYLDGNALYPRYCLESIAVNEKNPYFTAADGVLFNKDKTKLLAMVSTYHDTNYTVPESVTEIGDHAFSFTRNVYDITVFENVKTFGRNPFYNDDENRAVVCYEGSPAEKAAEMDQVSIILIDTGIVMPETLSMGLGEEYTVKATVFPDIEDKTITWKTSNSKVLTVNKGKLTAKRVGTAKITATNSKGKSAICTVTVKSAPESLRAAKTDVTIGIGETITIDSIVNESSAAAGITCTVDNDIVSFDAGRNGCCFTGVKEGTATVTMQTYNGKTASVKVTVKAAPESISMNVKSITIGVGETVVIGSTVNSGSAATDRKYISSDENIAAVNPTSWNCSFTGISVGQTKITVTAYNGKKDECLVTVKSPPRTVKPAKTEITLGIGETMKLSSAFLENEASYKLTYRSSDNEKVKMLKTSGVGEFEAVQEGAANIIVTAYNGATGKCHIIVKPSPKVIYVNRGLMEMKVGETAQLYSYLDEGYASSNRTWRTSNSKVVQMTNTNWIGKFKAVAPGVAYVTVRTQTGVEKSCKIIVTE